MKRERSETDTRKLGLKKTKHNDSSSMLGALTKELQIEIFTRVAMASCADINRSKLSCKLFKEIAEDGYIYRHVSLDEIPMSSWVSDENRESFLLLCEQYRNPETMYRQAVVDYFSKGSMGCACRYLQSAVDLGHEGAFYLTCLVLIYSGDEKSKEKGIKLLGEFKKSNCGRRKVREFRKKLKKHLGAIWVNNESLKLRPICCTTMEENHRKKLTWSSDEYEDSLECEACLAEFEVRCISGEFCS